MRTARTPSPWRQLSALAVAGVTAALLAGCGSGSSAATRTGSDEPVYEHAAPVASVTSMESCGGALPTKMLSSIGVTVSVKPRPGEFKGEWGVRWTGILTLTNNSDQQLPGSTYPADGVRAVLGDTPSKIVTTTPTRSRFQSMAASIDDGLGAGMSEDLELVFDSYECPPPGDKRLSLDGDAGLTEVPAGKHTVIAVLPIGNEDYRSNPIDVTLG